VQPFKSSNREIVPPQTAMLAYEFLAGTILQTSAGPVAVEHLVVGDSMMVQRGAQPLAAVSSRQIAVCQVVRIEDSTVGPDRPTRDVLLSPEQSVLVRDWRARCSTGNDRALIPAKFLVDGAFIRAETIAGQRVFALQFEEPVILTIEGLDVSVPATASQH
jgi:Hint domain